MITAKNILLNSYRISDCCDFCDIANSIETILQNCKLYHVSIFDIPSVYNRIKGFSKLYLQEKFRKQSDIDYCKKNLSYFTDILNYLETMSKSK